MFYMLKHSVGCGQGMPGLLSWKLVIAIVFSCFFSFVGLLLYHCFVYFLPCLLLLFLGGVDILVLICKHLDLWHCSPAAWALF